MPSPSSISNWLKNVCGARIFFVLARTLKDVKMKLRTLLETFTEPLFLLIYVRYIVLHSTLFSSNNGVKIHQINCRPKGRAIATLKGTVSRD